MFKRAGAIYREYPQQFWLLMGASLIDMTGGWMLFPFFALYFTQKFGVGMTEVGIIFGIYWGGNLVGNALGGALTDKFVRKAMVIIGLVSSASSSVAMGLLTNFAWMYPLTAFVGVFSNISGPAREAMIADLLPTEQITDGYGVFRIVLNLAATIGPMIGGLLAGIDFLILFLTDAVTSLITAGIVLTWLHETRSEFAAKKTSGQSLGQSFRGYGLVFRDLIFMAYLSFTAIVTLVYMQVNFSLPVFMRDTHGIPPQQYGYMLALMAAMVVVMQFWITRRVRNHKPMWVMTSGTVLYGIGFGMIGFISQYSLFITAMVIVTIGEMIIAPVGQAIVARLAPEEMRGRYMAVAALSWIIPGMIGPTLVGLGMDSGISTGLMWQIGGVLCLIGALGYLLLSRSASLQQTAVVTMESAP